MASSNKQLRICYGYKKECNKPAGGRFSIWYCHECDEARVADIIKKPK